MTRKNYVVVLTLFTLLCGVAWSQRLDGTLRGTVLDPSGAVVPGANVTVTSQQTGATRTAATTGAGTYVFPNLVVGPYTVTVVAPKFGKYERKNVEVLPNQIVTADAKLTLGSESTTVEVTTGAEAVQTSSSQLTNDFGGRAVSDLPNPGLGGSPLNLAMLAPNTTTQGAGVLGEGGSVGGARPRLNSFNIDGVDDNRVDVTGHTSEVIPEAIADFNLITNMFSAEQSHSAGGQFNLITRSGTNAWHGAGWEFNNNRDFNAMDNLEKGSDLTEPRRIDRNRLGGMIGGPIIKNKLFVFGAYQFNNLGLSSSSVQQLAPTTAGLTALNTLATGSVVKSYLAQFPTATSACNPSDPNCVSPVINGVTIPVGFIQPSAPNFQNEHNFDISTDLNLAKHQVRWRFLYDRTRSPNVNPISPLSQFTGAIAADSRKAIMTDAWTVNDRMVNDFRISYSRFVQDFTVPGQFANFPNVEIDNLGLNVGPEGNSPQSYHQNNYQVLDTITIVKGKHSIKFGPEYRRWIAPSSFLPRERGEWDYANLSPFILDQIPNGSNGALRGAGSGNFDGNQYALYGFVQDDWKATPRLTLNLGVRYEWYSNPAGSRLQTLNSLSSTPNIPLFTHPIENVPSAYVFRQPKTDKNNFMPRVGFALDVFGDGKTALRGGFGVSFDVTPQNFPLLELPPQLQSEQNPTITCSLPGAPSWCPGFLAGGPGTGFLQGGGLLSVNVPPATVTDAQSATQGIILDTVEPKVLTWTLSLQREVFANSSIELRYLGTRATQLPIQARLNTLSAFDAGLQPLPTFFSQSQIPSVITTPTRQSDFNNFNPFQQTPFSTVTAFPALAGSIYHGASVDFNHRFTKGIMVRADYTWSHNIDDATNELFSSLVNPRRPYDWRNLGLDRGNSVLDVRHKFALAWVYDLPKMKTGNGFLKTVANGWEWSGTYLAQSGQPITPLSVNDANANGDAAGDPAVFNPFGTQLAGSTSSPVCAGAGGAVLPVCPTIVNPDGTTSPDPAFIAGYIADNPKAKFVQAGTGALSTAGRNSFRSPGVNVWNMGMYKDTKISERFSLQFRASAQDVFNHRNFSLAQPTVFETGSILGTTNNALSSTYADVTSPLFLSAKQFTGGSRLMELGIKLIF